MLARRDMANAVEFKTVSNSAWDLEGEFLTVDGMAISKASSKTLQFQGLALG